MPEGERIYAIGDIHGCLELFEAMVAAIDDDDLRAGNAESQVILLGDLIDRGPDSAGVIALVRQWMQRRRVRVLLGNHEEMFLDSFEDSSVLGHFLKYGGRETIISYGVDPRTVDQAPLAEVQSEMNAAVPRDDRDFLASFEDMIEVGDYLFVHAGIDPERDRENQIVSDLRWIREPFLSHEEPHSHMIVHGHTISEDIQERSNRIGIDTGAYRHGCLTAAVFEADSRRFLQVREVEGEIVLKERSASR